MNLMNEKKIKLNQYLIYIKKIYKIICGNNNKMIYSEIGIKKFLIKTTNKNKHTIPKNKKNNKEKIEINKNYDSVKLNEL